MPKTQGAVEYQEIVAALMLAGPFDEQGYEGWTAREMSVACPSVREPHRASQILHDLAKLGVSRHAGRGQETRHLLKSLESCPESWRPGRDLLKRMSEIRSEVAFGLREVHGGGAHVRAWIWEAWAATPAVPLTKKEILAGVRKTHPDCPEHPVSQQLYEMARSGKLRRHKESGKAVAFIPVREPDLFTMAEYHFAKRVPLQAANIPSAEPMPSAGPIRGILPEISVFFGESGDVKHDHEVRAFVALDGDGNIRSVRIADMAHGLTY